jgi:hypothetical protein
VALGQGAHSQRSRGFEKTASYQGASRAERTDCPNTLGGGCSLDAAAVGDMVSLGLWLEPNAALVACGNLQWGSHKLTKPVLTAR